jgi:hypothetical protein
MRDALNLSTFIVTFGQTKYKALFFDTIGLYYNNHNRLLFLNVRWVKYSCLQEEFHDTKTIL